MMNPDDTVPSGQPPFAATGSLPRLLVVDDQPVNLQILYEIFHQDHKVFCATSGVQAVEMCRKNPPDLILLDVLMPEMDGLEVCRQLKNDPLTREIPVLFVTAQEDPEDEARALDAGGVDFISKPVNPVVVRARVLTHLTLKNRTDLLRTANKEMMRKNDDLQESERRLSEKIAELEAALKKVRQLEGIIPICMHCKKIRNDDDYWQNIEQYISEHSQAMFSHGVCPSCLQEHYGDYINKKTP